jgi:hypothetical protein
MSRNNNQSWVVDVKVSEGTLWIGSSMYPLNNITSVRPLKYSYREPKARQLNGCGLTVGYFAIIAGIQFGIHHYKWFGTSSNLVSSIVAVALLIAFVAAYIEDRQPGTLRTYYQLEVETAGSSRVALTVENPSVAHELTRRIAAAINDPRTAFNMQVENIHVGDTNTTHGPGSPIIKGRG